MGAALERGLKVSVSETFVSNEVTTRLDSLPQNCNRRCSDNKSAGIRCAGNVRE